MAKSLEFKTERIMQNLLRHKFKIQNKQKITILAKTLIKNNNKLYEKH